MAQFWVKEDGIDGWPRNGWRAVWDDEHGMLAVVNRTTSQSVLWHKVGYTSGAPRRNPSAEDLRDELETPIPAPIGGWDTSKWIRENDPYPSPHSLTMGDWDKILDPIGNVVALPLPSLASGGIDVDSSAVDTDTGTPEPRGVLISETMQMEVQNLAAPPESDPDPFDYTGTGSGLEGNTNTEPYPPGFRHPGLQLPSWRLEPVARYWEETLTFQELQEQNKIGKLKTIGRLLLILILIAFWFCYRKVADFLISGLSDITNSRLTGKSLGLVVICLAVVGVGVYAYMSFDRMPEGYNNEKHVNTTSDPEIKVRPRAETPMKPKPVRLQPRKLSPMKVTPPVMASPEPPQPSMAPPPDAMDQEPPPMGHYRRPKPRPKIMGFDYRQLLKR